MHIFMNLQRDSPAGIFFNIGNNFRNDFLKPAPLRLKKESAFGINQLTIFFCPFKIILNPEL